MICPKCNFENPDGAKYCQKCANIFGVNSAQSSENTTHTTEPKIEVMPRKNIETQNNYQGLTPNHEDLKHHKKKSLKTIILIIIGVLVVAGLAYAGYWGYNNYFSNTPEKVIARSVEVMADVESLNFYLGQTTDISKINELWGGSLFFEELEGEETYYNLNGQVDFENKENIKIQVEIDAGILDKNSNQVDPLKGNIIFLNNDLYFLITMLSTDFDHLDKTKVENRWVKVSLTDEIGYLNIFQGLQNELIQNEEVEVVFKQNLNNIFKIIQEHESESIDGHKCYKYSIELNWQGLIDALNETKDNIENEEAKEKIEDLIVDSESKNNQNKNHLLKIWIDKKSYQIRQIITDDESQYGENSIKSEITLKMNNFNQPAIIEAPEGFIGIEEFIADTIGDIFGGALTMEMSEEEKDEDDLRMVRDVMQIQTALELYYNENNEYPEVLDGKPANFSKFMGRYPTPPNSELDGSEYVYETKDKKSYQIPFTLKNGTDYDERYATPGKYVATPNGIELLEATETDLDDELFDDDNFELDSDNDGLDNWTEENVYNTDPTNPDTDGDGYLDGIEVENGYDPLS